MCRGRAVYRDTNSARVVEGNRKLRLNTGKGHRHAVVANKEGFIWQFLYNSLKILRLAYWPPLNRGCSSWLTNRECACSIAADCGEQTNYVAARHPEKLSKGA